MNNTERKEIERCRDLAETIWQSDGGWYVSSEIADLKDTLARLLSAPPCNCDVGTAEEQVKRHIEWCDSNICKFTYSCRVCFANWAQMPYEKGAVK